MGYYPKYYVDKIQVSPHHKPITVQWLERNVHPQNLVMGNVHPQNLVMGYSAFFMKSPF